MSNSPSSDPPLPDPPSPGELASASPESPPELPPLEPAAPEPAAPERPPAKPVAAEGLHYLRAYQYVFESRDWPLNLLLPSLLVLIPVLGPVLVFGYVYEVLEALHRGRDQPYPKFDLKQYVAYAHRGVWPYILFAAVQSILVVPMVMLLETANFSIIFSMAANPRVGVLVMAIVIPLVVCAVIAINLVVAILEIPFQLRAGLSQDFGHTLRPRWVADFLRRTWLECLLATLFSMVTATLLMLAGTVCLCCYGAIPAAMLAGLASTHLEHQLYRLYLARGGEPIPLKPIQGEMPPVAPPPA